MKAGARLADRHQPVVAEQPCDLGAQRREDDGVHQGQPAEIKHCDLLGAGLAVPITAAGDDGAALDRGARHSQGGEGVEAAPPHLAAIVIVSCLPLRSVASRPQAFSSQFSRPTMAVSAAARMACARAVGRHAPPLQRRATLYTSAA